MSLQGTPTTSSDEDCQLGRHEYWEGAYARELDNYKDHGDEGEIWFGSEVLDTMVEWTDQILQQRSSDAKALEILDLGTGNGSFLFRLARLGYRNLTGCDYSKASIALAKAIAARSGDTDIRWLEDDFLATKLTCRYDILTDKGTLDAVGLSANAAENRLRYQEAAKSLLRPRGLLIVTSCNSTAAELQAEFCGGERPFFEFVGKVITYPVFRFGGVEGSKVCTLAFQTCELGESVA